MAFQRPKLEELIERVEGDFRAGLGLTVLIRRSLEKVLARAMAGMSHLLFFRLDYIERQAFPDSAEDEYLERWAGIYGITRKPATFSEFTVNLVGSAGVVIPAGRTYRRSDGKEYTTKTEVNFAGTSASVVLVAVAPGKDSAPQVGDAINILSAIAGLNSTAVVASIVTEAENTEDDTSLQARLLDRIQNPPSGGAANDYIQWAREVPGVTRAWVGPRALGPGTVTVWPVTDGTNPITPSPAKINEIATYIETLRPVTATVTVVAPVLNPITLTIAIKPNLLAVRNAITAELQDLIYRDANVAGSWAGPNATYDGKILLSRINEAISIAAGESDHSIVSINGVAPANVTPPTGGLCVLGAITWQTLA